MPESMALAAFDDFDAATLVRPTITVVRQPIAELGERPHGSARPCPTQKRCRPRSLAYRPTHRTGGTAIMWVWERSF